MRRLLNILACLMLVFSFGATATAHALERSNTSIGANDTRGEQIAEECTSGDADQVPADAANGYPHHHGGCHVHPVAAPVKIASTAHTRDLHLAPVFSGRSMRPLSTADPALRPPQV